MDDRLYIIYNDGRVETNWCKLSDQFAWGYNANFGLHTSHCCAVMTPDVFKKLGLIVVRALTTEKELLQRAVDLEKEAGL